jgi:ssDNA-binding Zn-finger/Zn-ribbon topoisomerase 1
MGIRQRIRFRRAVAAEIERVTPIIEDAERQLDAVRESAFRALAGLRGAAPRCPRCGSSMVLRTAQKGRYEGQEFWGCSRYPACEGLRNIAGTPSA